ncbi:MAG TPA: hypothetical protein VF894_07405 [Anaeromyxobacter sp.]
MTGPLLALALAAGPELLLPPWPLSPDGDLVAVRSAAALAADGAAVEPVAAGLYRVVPAPGAARVTLRAGGAEISAPVEPPPGVVEIEVRTHAPVKGRDLAVEIELAVRRAGGEPDAEAAPPSIAVSSGRLRDLAPTGPGRYHAVYEPAPTRHPEVAVLLALVPRCPLCPTPRAVGHAIVPLSAAIDLPGHSEPGTRTTVTVAGRAFGPAVADARGRFSIPIVVPPGARFGAATSVDRSGNRRTTEIDLQLPEVDRLACTAWPRTLPADGRAEASVWCVASTPAGAPAEGAQLALGVSPGEVGPLARVRGPLQRAQYRAPAGGGGADAVVRATYPEGGAASRDEVRIALVSGAPAEIVARLAHEPVPRGATVPAETAVRDARGDLLGRPAGPSGAKEGFVAPDKFVAATAGAVQHAPLAFALPAGTELASLALRREGRSWVAEARTADGRPAAGVRLRFGGGAEATTDARGEARENGTADRETVVGPGGVRAAGWAGIAPPGARFELARTVEVALRPPSPVDVFASVEAGAIRWRVEDSGGRPLAERRVTLRAEGVELGPAERDGDGGRAAIRRGRGLVAVEDAETGVAAVVEVP